MTRMIDALARRPAAQRVLIAIVLAMVGVLLVGITAGIGAAIFEKGLPKKTWVLALGALAAPAGLALLALCWKILQVSAGRSGYEQRYWRTWILLAAISVPVGIVAGMLTVASGLDPSQVFSQAPLIPEAALALAVLISVTLVAALVMYHRTVDDHEERAYLWGSQLAYYLLVVAFPAWWLLERGGLLPPIDTFIAFIAILLSFVVQGAVWAWLKFR